MQPSPNIGSPGVRASLDAARADAVGLGVDGMFTNFPNRLEGVLGKKAATSRPPSSPPKPQRPAATVETPDQGQVKVLEAPFVASVSAGSSEHLARATPRPSRAALAGAGRRGGRLSGVPFGAAASSDNPAVEKAVSWAAEADG